MRVLMRSVSIRSRSDNLAQHLRTHERRDAAAASGLPAAAGEELLLDGEDLLLLDGVDGDGEAEGEGEGEGEGSGESR